MQSLSVQFVMLYIFIYNTDVVIMGTQNSTFKMIICIKLTIGAVMICTDVEGEKV
jgi:hypothetical protein